MNDNARKWIKALRSGKFNQTQSKLCRIEPTGEESFCCLGVACELYLAEGGDLDVVTENEATDGSGVRYRGYNGEEGYAPAPVKDWLGLDSDAGVFHVGNTRDNLAEANDAGLTFDQIADIIEAEPEGLFA